jgi:anti-sigma factor RsiW
MNEEDAELVALIDNEVDEGSRGALQARFATDDRLRQRYEELRAAGATIAGSLEELLGQAPWSACEPRFRRTDPFAGGRADSPAMVCDSLRLALLSGSWRQAQPHGLRRALGCSRNGTTGVRPSSNTQTFTPTTPSVP